MTEIFMPKAGMDMQEGRLIRWLKNVGDPVELDEPIMEIETDKIVMEAEAPATGILLAKLVDDDTTVPVLQTIGWIGQPGEKIPDDLGAPAADAPAAEEVAPASAAEAAPAVAAVPADGFITATPLARKIAEENGINLADLADKMPVKAEDVEELIEARKAGTPRYTPEVAFIPVSAPAPAPAPAVAPAPAPVSAPAPAAAPKVPSEGREPIHVPLTSTRKAIARNMLQSLQNMAQTSNSVEIDVTELMEIKETLSSLKQALGVKITINDLLSYAAVKMIRSHPLANASFADTEIIEYPYVNLCTAVATDYGLTSPVVHDADRLNLIELSHALHDVSSRARSRALTADDMSGGTFTLSNLGIFPVDSFTPIVPYPQSCILGFGRCVKKPAVWNDELCIRTRMTLSVTYDHRVFDGAEVGSILQTMKDFLENPKTFLDL